MSTAPSRGVALVTGAGGAIGRACCARLQADGYQVVGVDLQPWQQAVPGVQFMSCDVTDEAAVSELMRHVEQQTGPIHALINVAGIVSKGSALTLPIEELERVLRVNVLGSFIPCQQVARRMVARGAGSIINIGSVVGKNSGNARPWIDPAESENAGNVAYGMSKAAVHSLTGFLARELAHQGVRVNAVAPGPIATSMTDSFPATLKALVPAGRMGHPDEVAHTVSFLLDEQAGFICGEVIDINGALWCD